MFGITIRTEEHGTYAVDQRQVRGDYNVVRVMRPALPYGFTRSAWYVEGGVEYRLYS